MRIGARQAGIAVPDFVGIFNYDDVRGYVDAVPAPWLLKPRTSASTIGIRKLIEPEQLWRALDELGDRQSFHLLERFLPGDVFHVDGIAVGGELAFAEVHRYARPPLEVYHGGGLFCSRTVERGSADDRALRELSARLVTSLGLEVGAVHAEFIKAAADSQYYFLETAARVGGANIVEMVEAATGVNLWREWARVEVAAARDAAYEPPRPGDDYGGVINSLARQEWPDMSAYQAPEIVWRQSKRHHAGLVLATPDPRRLQMLLDDYMGRFYADFFATLPPAERPTS